tara:strand:- start:21 stop:695 length:675 start_codon:yes stop_codon:yes gene_type:complete
MSSLHLLLDSADPRVWEDSFQTGVFNGITTNPSLLKKANQSCSLSNLKKLTQKAEEIGYKEIHLQSWGSTPKELIECGFSLKNFQSKKINIYIKLPITKEGTEAAKVLIKNQIPITFTACYETSQILIAAAVGASFVAPYLKRINQQGINAEKEIIKMQKILNGIGSSCKLLVASIENIENITNLSSEGINVFTINKNIYNEFFKVKNTIEAANFFERESLENK